jgi:CTP synthase (UTP-ammonia lyase)
MPTRSAAEKGFRNGEIGEEMMNRSMKIGIIGDLSVDHSSRVATDAALNHAAAALSVSVDCSWLPTLMLEKEGVESALTAFDALWCGPGSPYASMEAALLAIRFARERDRPFVAT